MGHGTHVAGIAAGDGSSVAINSAYGGVASGADIIFVKTTFMGGDIVDGVNYIFQKAKALGRPCVVNLSLGSQESSHDGRQAGQMSKMISDLCSSGYMVAAAMGNERGSQQHTETTIGSGGKGTITFTQSSGSFDQYVSIWHHKSDAYSVLVKGPGGTSPSRSSGGSSTYSVGGYTVSIYNADGSPMRQSDGDKNIIVEIQGNSDSGSTWNIELTRTTSGGNGAVDAWFALASDGGRFNSASDTELVASPAEGNNVIKVAAIVSRTDYPAADGYSYSYDVGTRGSYANFSNPGPLRRGSASSPNTLQAPDVSAPGAVIASSKSSTVSYSSSQILRNTNEVMMSGTSMATPHVTGALALALQYHPTLSASEFRSLMAANAAASPTAPIRRDLFNPSLDNNYGYGKINALGLVKLFQKTAAHRWADYK